MSGLATILKRMAKEWVRPLLIPIVRPWVRYAPHECIRGAVWRCLVAPFLQHANRRFVVSTVFGAVISGNTQDLVQRYIFYFGVWEPNLTEFLIGNLRQGDVFIDVGANIGYFTLLASRLVGSAGKVIAIEASPGIFAKLRDNLERNRVTNVEAINVAASDRRRDGQSFPRVNSNIGATSIVPTEGSRYECDVPASTLDSILAPADVRNARFVKIDVEGAEGLVIAGMRDVLRNARPSLPSMRTDLLSRPVCYPLLSLLLPSWPMTADSACTARVPSQDSTIHLFAHAGA